jgi:hypothetical protein
MSMEASGGRWETNDEGKNTVERAATAGLLSVGRYAAPGESGNA